MAFGTGFRRRWERNAGLRIDHILLSPDLEQTLPAAGVDTWVRDKLMPRDHAPVWVELELSPPEDFGKAQDVALRSGGLGASKPLVHHAHQTFDEQFALAML